HVLATAKCDPWLAILGYASAAIDNRAIRVIRKMPLELEVICLAVVGGNLELETLVQFALGERIEELLGGSSRVERQHDLIPNSLYDRSTAILREFTDRADESEDV